MTLDDVKERVAQIMDIAGKRDHEMAHRLEDSLYTELLTAIGRGKCDDPAKCATFALGTANIPFRRMCA